MTRTPDDLPWPPPVRRAAPSRDELLSPATQIVGDREDYLGQGGNDIGRRIADDQYELFVTCDPAEALQQQFDRLHPDFIALHDVGASTSLRLLGALAGASGARVQRLSIRRQGAGVPLAVLQFVEAPLADGSKLRVYTTDINADSQTRQQLALVLLARSRLGVLMVGELPPHALTAALQPLQEAIHRGPWPNRDLLLLPLGSATALAAQAAQLAGRSGVVLRVTPQASRPNDAWAFISGGWNRVQGQAGGSATLTTDLAQAVPRPPVPMNEAPTQAMDLGPAQVAAPRPMPMTLPMPVPGGVRWDLYAERCLRVKGAISACVFDMHSQRPVAHAGGRPPAERVAAQGVILLSAMGDAGRSLGLGTDVRDASVSLAGHHLLLRPVPRHPGIVLHLVIDGNTGNPTLARMQLERIEVG
jgi:hypothetical protein